MTRTRHGKKTHHARRDVKRAMRTRARKLDPDQIQANLNDPKKLDALQNPQQLDVDKAGLGLFYCVECDRNFPSQKDQLTHIASKLHKRVAKKIHDEQAYTVEESLRAAGIGVDNQQRRPQDMATKPRE
ncbi:hypothetical protein BCV70DRAFT_202210 [Testicularia cyperi]|uniref:C2H2-type domain-containing protein n=1 Tax=Testicularia cyperi TaxID=1882483 RepID=A0A317XIW7_9BASI|nr:hypothetical protein BCV70DRAFT_202210 [Testicularia cyperi]